MTHFALVNERFELVVADFHIFAVHAVGATVKGYGLFEQLLQRTTSAEAFLQEFGHYKSQFFGLRHARHATFEMNAHVLCGLINVVEGRYARKVAVEIVAAAAYHVDVVNLSFIYIGEEDAEHACVFLLYDDYEIAVLKTERVI